LRPDVCREVKSARVGNAEWSRSKVGGHFHSTYLRSIQGQESNLKFRNCEHFSVGLHRPVACTLSMGRALRCPYILACLPGPRRPRSWVFCAPQRNLVAWSSHIH